MSRGSTFRIGVDTGGTFTDFVVIKDGEIEVFKELSTPNAPDDAIMLGIGRLTVASVKEVIHGSTVATNALLERKGARTALLTTEGFEDVLVIGRQTRRDLYNVFVTRPEPLVPDGLRQGALALGASRARAVLTVVLPAALPGILTGVLVALARIAGETAPLLFTAFNNRYWSLRVDQPIASLTVQVYTYAISPYDDWHRQAWAGATVLIGAVLLFSLMARLATRRLQRMHRG